jgi:hypothetical protein
MKTILPITNLLIVTFLLGLSTLPLLRAAETVPVGEETVPVGEGTVPVGEGTVPVGEGTVPVGEGTVPVGEGTVPVGEGTVPVGEGTVPVGEGTVPVGEETVPIGERATFPHSHADRVTARMAAAKHPRTASLFAGNNKARYAAAARKISTAIRKPGPDDAAALATLVTRAKRDQQWAAGTLASAAPHQDGLFDKSWWEKNGTKIDGPSFYFSRKSPTAWWKSATWESLTKTLGWQGAPFYYDYGGNVVFKNEVIYLNSQPVGSQEDLAASARQLAESSSPSAGSKSSWTSLGTFAISQSLRKKSAAMAIQLAIDEEGTISGSYYHWANKDTQPIRGHAEQGTQRVALKIGTGNIILETGLANLTRSEGRIWVHLADGRSLVWLFARMPSS